MQNTFQKGLFMGGLLAVAALFGFAMTKPGKRMTAALEADVKVAAKRVKEIMEYVGDITRESFDEIVSKVVNEYARDKALAMETKDEVIAVLQSKWEEMKRGEKANEKPA